MARAARAVLLSRPRRRARRAKTSEAPKPKDSEFMCTADWTVYGTLRVIEAVEWHSRYQAMSQEDVNLVVDFTNRVLGSSGLDLKAVGEDSDDGFRIQVRGDDVALLLGRNAELLDALEYLGNRILARSSGEEAKIVF